MIDIKNADKVKKEIFDLLGIKNNISVEIENGDGLLVEYENNFAKITCNKVYQLCRALMLVGYNISLGKDSFVINEKANFGKCGAMLDMSRNGVFRVESVKKYLLYMATMGMNVLYLYLEDVYELEDYPHFGYMRGRYTKEEIKEIDAYARELDIEVIASIQTLGHMEQYLRWQDAENIRDARHIMLAGEEETYKLIEASLKFFSEALSTKNIHIGMDEAHDIGLGRYLDKNGYCNRFNIFTDHLERVLEICNKYELKPMIWSDMYFKLGSEKKIYWDAENKLSKEDIAKIPDVGLVYWDYYHDDEDYYKAMMVQHKRMSKRLIFAGGIWTWDGLSPNYHYSFHTMKPALKAARECGADEVYATLWSDDGCQTNHFFSLVGLALFSEYNYSENVPDDDYIYSIAEYATKFSKETALAMDDFTHRMSGSKMLGTQYIWTDFLLDTVDFKVDYDETLKNFKKAGDVFLKDSSLKNEWKEYYRYLWLLSEIAYRKCGMCKDLKTAYNENNREYLKNYAEKEIPQIKELYKELKELHKKQWMDTYKAFGWEVIHARYAILLERAEYAKDKIEMYLSGELKNIEELDFPTLYQKEGWGKDFKKLVTGSVRF